MFQTKVVIKTHFVYLFIFSESLAVYDIMWKKYGRVGKATGDNMAQALCVLDT
jgi:hypothetical protein